MIDNELYIGVGATICYWSDRHPATVIQIFYGGKKLILQEDLSTRTDNNGLSESQEYSYEKDPNGTVHIATLRKNGKYKISKSNTPVIIGVRQKYHDYSF